MELSAEIVTVFEMTIDACVKRLDRSCLPNMFNIAHIMGGFHESHRRLRSK